MFERIRHILRKEFIQVLRDPRMKVILFVMPVLQLIIFGYAVTTDVDHIRTAIYDLDRTPSSRDLVARFVKSGYYDIVATVESDNEVQRLFNSGRALIVLRVNSGFEGDLRSGRTAQVQLLADGTDSNTARIALNYSQSIVSRFSREALRDRISRLRGAVRVPAQVSLETRSWFNENLVSRNYYVPGVMAMLVMLATLFLTSMAIVREREIGTMEQILVTPIRPIEFILGKTAPFAIIGYIDVFIVLAVAVFWFGVPVRGSVLLLLASTFFFLLPVIGVGLLISSFCRTQQQAMLTTFFFALPAVLLSGFMFPIANMPEAVQWLTLADPLRYFLVIIRGIFLKGVGADILWPQMAALALLGVVSLTIAWKQFHKTVS